MSISNLSLVAITNEYFNTYGRTPKQSYTESDLYQIAQQAMVYLTSAIAGDGNPNALSETFSFLQQEANLYGVNVTEAVQFLKDNPDYQDYILNTAANSGSFPTGSQTVFGLLHDFGAFVTGGISSFILGALSGLLPILLIGGAAWYFITQTKTPKNGKK